MPQHPDNATATRAHRPAAAVPDTLQYISVHQANMSEGSPFRSVDNPTLTDKRARDVSEPRSLPCRSAHRAAPETAGTDERPGALLRPADAGRVGTAAYARRA